MYDGIYAAVYIRSLLSHCLRYIPRIMNIGPCCFWFGLIPVYFTIYHFRAGSPALGQSHYRPSANEITLQNTSHAEYITWLYFHLSIRPLQNNTLQKTCIAWINCIQFHWNIVKLHYIIHCFVVLRHHVACYQPTDRYCAWIFNHVSTWLG